MRAPCAQLYALTHRDAPAGGAAELPPFADPLGREALRLLFSELKIAEDERVPYGLLADHPLGTRLLERCVSYEPKEPYALVAQMHAHAGDALKM